MHQLPQDIRFLQALCFLGKGGADYAAIKAIYQLMPSLSPESELHLEEEMIDTGMYLDPSWLVFQHKATSMISVTEAAVRLALFSQSFGEDRDIQLSKKFLPLYKEHLSVLENNDVLSRDGIKRLSSNTKFSIIYLTGLYQDFLIALARMHLLRYCKKKNKVGECNKSGEHTLGPDEIVGASFVINLIERYRDILWRSPFEIIKPVPLVVRIIFLYYIRMVSK